MRLVSIVVPVYHNAGSLPELVERFQQVAEGEPEEFEFVFVDDGSRDESFEVLEKLTVEEPRVRAIKLARNFGSSAASSAGITHARGDAVIAISADLQDPPELISQMLAKWREGYRIVLAARAGRKDPLITSLTSTLFWKLFRRFALPTMPKQGCDYCLIDRRVLESLRDTHEPNAGIGMILWTGFEPAVIEYHRQERQVHHGRSMWTLSKKVTYFIDSFVSFSHLPIRAASILGILTGTLGVCGAVFIFCTYAFSLFDGQRAVVPGWASMIVVSLIVGGIQLLMTGILGEYLVRTLESTRRRPTFVIDRIVDNTSHENDALEPQVADKYR